MMTRLRQRWWLVEASVERGANTVAQKQTNKQAIPVITFRRLYKWQLDQVLTLSLLIVLIKTIKRKTFVNHKLQPKFFRQSINTIPKY